MKKTILVADGNLFVADFNETFKTLNSTFILEDILSVNLYNKFFNYILAVWSYLLTHISLKFIGNINSVVLVLPVFELWIYFSSNSFEIDGRKGCLMF